MRRLIDNVPVAIFWRYATHSAMVGMALINEMLPAASLHDVVLSHLPRVEWIANHNYHLWLLCYIPLAFWLWKKNREDFLGFLWLGGWLSLIRGICILATGLGPVNGHDVNASLTTPEIWRAWLRIVNPVSALSTDVAHVYLTKDLFFSGHVATTFLLWLYCRRHKPLGALALAGHVVTVASVFLAHLHYTIDVIGAWAITFAVYAWVNRPKSPSANSASQPLRAPSVSSGVTE